MAVEIGEAREQWGRDVWNKAEEFASHFKHDPKPFYVVFCAKADRGKDNTFRQSFRFYRQRPPKLIGLLVWYADNAQGIFQLVPELSIPPDVPIDPLLLSEDRADAFPTVMEKGEAMRILHA